MERLEKKIRTIWILQGFIISIVITALFFLPIYLGELVHRPLIWAAVIFVISFCSLSGYMLSRYDNWGFDLKEDYLFLKHGVLIKKRSMVPYVRVQHIDTQRGVIDRLAGLSKMVVYTAGSRGADVTIPGLLPGKADRIQRWLRDEAIRSEEKDAV